MHDRHRLLRWCSPRIRNSPAAIPLNRSLPGARACFSTRSRDDGRNPLSRLIDQRSAPGTPKSRFIHSFVAIICAPRPPSLSRRISWMARHHRSFDAIHPRTTWINATDADHDDGRQTTTTDARPRRRTPTTTTDARPPGQHTDATRRHSILCV